MWIPGPADPMRTAVGAQRAQIQERQRRIDGMRRRAEDDELMTSCHTGTVHRILALLRGRKP